MEHLTPEQIQAALAHAQNPNAPQEAEAHVPVTQDVTPTEVVPSLLDSLKASPSDPREIELPDGRKVIIQKPAKATKFHIAKVLGRNSANPMLDLYYGAFMWVRQVGSTPIPFLATERQFEGLQDLLGDDGLEALVAATLDVPGVAVDVEAVKK
jgi:hypothetical protein